MGFEGLLGNQRLKDNLSGSLRQGRAAHFYLISGPEGSGKGKLARLLSAALMCTGTGQPCLQCPACRKVMDGVHPDIITVRDPDRKQVPVDMVRQARSDVFVQPNEGKKKIYIFPQELGLPGQNALLKILEEPPSYGVFLLLTDNPERLLPTVRSRCVELTLSPVEQTVLLGELKRRFPQAQEADLLAACRRSGGYLGQAVAVLSGAAEVAPQTEALLRAFAHRDTVALVTVLTGLEKAKRDVLIPLMGQWAGILQEALVCRSGGSALSPLARELSTARNAGELLDAIRTLQKCMEYAQGNVSCAAVCGYLQWALR